MGFTCKSRRLASYYRDGIYSVNMDYHHNPIESRRLGAFEFVGTRQHRSGGHHIFGILPSLFGSHDILVEKQGNYEKASLKTLTSPFICEEYRHEMVNMNSPAPEVQNIYRKSK